MSFEAPGSAYNHVELDRTARTLAGCGLGGRLTLRPSACVSVAESLYFHLNSTSFVLTSGVFMFMEAAVFPVPCRSSKLWLFALDHDEFMKACDELFVAPINRRGVFSI